MHYNNTLIRKIKRVDYESEAFKWDDTDGSDAGGLLTRPGMYRGKIINYSKFTLMPRCL